MDTRRIALIAALAAVTGWAAKSIAIGTAGGAGKSPLEGPRFFAGLVPFAVSVVVIGVALTSGRRTWVRVAAGVGAFVVGFASSVALDAAVGALIAPGVERHWVWMEVNLWVVALVGLGVAVMLNRKGEPSPTP